MRFSLKNLINPSIPLSLFIVLLITLIWGMSFFLNLEFDLNTESTYLGEKLLKHLSNNYLSKALSYVFVLLNSFIILQIDNKYNIIRKKNFLLFYLYFFLISAYIPIHSYPLFHISTSLYIFAFFVLMSMYANDRAVEPAFISCLLLSCASFFLYEILFLIPFFWIIYYSFNSLSFKVFLASLFGVLTPWFVLFSVIYLFFEAESITHLIESFYIFEFALPQFNLFTFVCAAILLGIMLTLIFGTLSDFKNNSIQNRRYLSVHILLLVITLLITLFMPNISLAFFPILSFHVCFIASYCFAAYLNKFYTALFVIFVIVSILSLFFYPYSLTFPK